MVRKVYWIFKITLQWQDSMSFFAVSIFLWLKNLLIVNYFIHINKEWWFSCNPLDCSHPVSSVHGVSQANILKWVAIAFSRGIFPTQGSNPCLLHCRQIIYHWATMGAQIKSQFHHSVMSDHGLQASLSITNPQSLLKSMSVELMMLSNHFILCRLLLLLTSIFSSIRVFSNESVFQNRWPKYWNFSFSISLFNEYSGLISFSWISVKSKGLSSVFSKCMVQKHQFFRAQLYL